MHVSIEAAHNLLSAGKTRYHELDLVMKDLGWDYLASGAFSKVYLNHAVPGKVIKVSRGDDAVQAYVLYCQANPSKFLPVYEDFAEYPVQGQCRPMSIVTMDSLERFSYAGEPGNEWPDFQAGVYSYSAWKDEAEEAEKHRRIPLMPGSKRARCMEAWHEGWKMASFFGQEARWDLHDGNVMIDPATGHMQVTDPLYNEHEDNTLLIAKLQHWRYLPQLSEQLELALEGGPEVGAQIQEVPWPGVLPAPALRRVPGQQVELMKARQVSGELEVVLQNPPGWPQAVGVSQVSGGLRTLEAKARDMAEAWAKRVRPVIMARDHSDLARDPRFQAQRVRVIRERLGLRGSVDWYSLLSRVEAMGPGAHDWRGLNFHLPKRNNLRLFGLEAQLPGVAAGRVVHLTCEDIREISLYLEQRNAQRAPINFDFSNVEKRMAAALRRGV